MPIPLIRTLKLARGQKTGLISIFCLGAFVIAASIVRMVMLRSSAGSHDPTWGSMIALIWTEIEANTSVIVCCLPALRVPFLNLWHKLRGGKRSATPTVDGLARPMYENAWTGPHHSQAAAAHQPTKPQRSHQSHNVRASVSGSHGKSAHSHSSVSRTGDTWYDKVLQSLSKEKDSDQSRTSSQDELSRAEAAMPPRLELGAIYKTTDVHVSTSDLRRAEEEEEEEEGGGRRQKQVTLQEMLNQDR